MSHFSSLRPYEDRLRTLLLLLQLMEGQSCFHGGSLCDAGVQRYSSLLFFLKLLLLPKKEIVSPSISVSASLCLSGKGIGKALMSKVAQVSVHTFPRFKLPPAQPEGMFRSPAHHPISDRLPDESRTGVHWPSLLLEKSKFSYFSQRHNLVAITAQHTHNNNS